MCIVAVNCPLIFVLFEYGAAVCVRLWLRVVGSSSLFTVVCRLVSAVVRCCLFFAVDAVAVLRCLLMVVECLRCSLLCVVCRRLACCCAVCCSLMCVGCLVLLFVV